MFALVALIGMVALARRLMIQPEQFHWMFLQDANR
jgi:hypothetical protein